MKKVGIITFHNALNYGAVIQMYALQVVVKRMGFNVELLDYRNSKIEDLYKPLPPLKSFVRKNIFKSASKLLKVLSTLKLRKEKYSKFDGFLKNELFLSSERYLAKQIPKDCDFYLLGSDQIWNTYITGGLDEIFWGQFEVKNGAKKIAYGASLEFYNHNFIKENNKRIALLLENFDHISVREKEVKDLLSKTVGVNAGLVLDPTLLLKKEDYSDIIELPVENNFVLVYHLTHSKEAIAIAENIAMKNNWKVIEICAGLKPFRNHKRYKQTLDPKQFLGYLNKAKFVVTTSFHGTALSIVFNKQFLVVNKGPGTRQRNILSLLDIEDRLVNNADADVNLIDYKSVNEKLITLQSSSYQFLEKALQ